MASPTSAEMQAMVASFLEVAAGQTADIASQFLKATNWDLGEAIQLFYGSDGGAGLTPPPISSQVDSIPMEREDIVANENGTQVLDDDGVRAPLPVRRETLYGDAAFSSLQPSSIIAFRNFEEESRRPAVWESDQGASSMANGSQNNLASLYSPPFALMFQGSFDKAKVEASLMDKWLIVNLQSTEEFTSHMLNRDTWANEAVAQTIRTNFIFWQMYNDSSEGRKVCTYYKIISTPAVLLIDPVTGQQMRAWSGMVYPDQLLENLLPYLEKGPKEHYVAHPFKRRRGDSQEPMLFAPGNLPLTEKMSDEDEEVARALAASLEDIKGPTVGSPSPKEDEDSQNEKDETPTTTTTTTNNTSSFDEKPTYPPLPEEPKVVAKENLCRIGVRLPNGKRLLRNFLRTDKIKLLWSFCSSQLEEGETRAFHFAQAIPGAAKSLDYSSEQTFEEAGLSNSMVSLIWD